MGGFCSPLFQASMYTIVLTVFLVAVNTITARLFYIRVTHSHIYSQWLLFSKQTNMAIAKQRWSTLIHAEAAKMQRDAFLINKMMVYMSNNQQGRCVTPNQIDLNLFTQIFCTCKHR